MIDIHDLATGNWVYDGKHTQFPMWVCSVQHDGYVTLDFKANEGMPWDANARDLEGIPLTEQLLMKIGFKQNFVEGVEYYSTFIKINDKRHLHLSVRLDKQRADITEISQKNFPDVELRLRSHIEDIFFLHELQNFCFLTTKQQLIINL